MSDIQRLWDALRERFLAALDDNGDVALTPAAARELAATLADAAVVVLQDPRFSAGRGE